MPVSDVNKKTLTEQVDDIVEAYMRGQDVTPMLSSLSPYARNLWDEALTQYRNSILASGQPTSEIIEQLKTADYISKPPTMQQFIEDPYYLGSIMVKSQDTEGMFPAWKEILCNDFNYDSAIHNCVITGSLGIGKCHGYNDLCMTLDGGVKAVQDIVTGDLLMGDDSKPRTVLNTVCGRGEMFEIISNDFDGFKVNADHILCLKFVGCTGITEISVKDFLRLPSEKRNNARLYRVPVEWTERPVTVDPYWLGLWIGDGHNHCPSITSADQEIVAYHQKYAESLGLTVNVIEDKRGNAAKLYTATNPDRSSRRTEGNVLALRLRSYGLCFSFKNKTDKHIPRDYLINSSKIRKQLLAGLIDTDGSASKAGKAGVFDITVKQKNLATQIRWLALSLGYGASRPKLKTVNSTAYWRVIIGGADDLPTKVQRKKSEPRSGKDYYQTAKFAIIPLGVDNYYGFTLDGNGRYLLQDFVVTHNTFIMVTILLYRILITTLLRNPHNFFGLSKGTKIIFNLLSVTKAAVTETAFGDAMNFMANSPYFLEECHYDPDLRYTGYRIPLKGSLLLTAGSRGQHLIGRNIIGVGLDEGNWRLEAEPDTKAYELYNEVRNRINNRFRKVAGYLPAISILASSAKDESSFTETIIAEIQKTNDPATQKVYRNSVYKIKRHTLQLGPKWFKVAYGLKNIPPMILGGWYTGKGEVLGEGPHEAAPPGASTELVPAMYYDEFKRRPLNALRDVCGISTGGVNRWFASMVDFEQCVELAEKEGVVNPVIGGDSGFEMLPLSMEDNKQLWDYLDHKKFLTRVQSQVLPKRHPSQLRYAHIDLATQTMAGIAISHLVGVELIENLVKRGDVVPFNEYRLIVEYDFILTVIAGQVKPISLEKIQNFIIWLSTQCGYNFGLVTFDQWQSEMSLQMLEARGFKVDKQSIDKNKDAYTNWRMAAEEHRLRPYKHRHMMWEAENLLDGDKKVDHPDKGCFTGDTRIALLDGTLPTFEELAQRYPNGEKFTVFSMSPNGIGYGEAHSPRITKKQVQLVEIILDNYQVIRCTSDHLFMTLDGNWIRAENLTPAVSLMPLYRSRSKNGGWAGYEQVWCPIRKRRLLIHQMVALQKFGFIGENLVHHENEIKHDNRPDNLKLETKSEHASHHTKKRHSTDPDYVKKLRKGHLIYRLNGGNEVSRQTIQKLYDEGKLKRGRELCAIEGCLCLSDSKGLCGKHYQKERRKALRKGRQNHRILNIRISEEKADVWDITVDSLHNFALASGIFVHNSKDTTDAAAGSYNNAINSEEKATMMASQNPRVHMNRDLENLISEKPLVEINLPPGYERLKTFKV